MKTKEKKQRTPSIYIVRDGTENVRLVRATSQGAARRLAVLGIEVRKPTQDELIANASVTIEEAVPEAN